MPPNKLLYAIANLEFSVNKFKNILVLCILTISVVGCSSYNSKYNNKALLLNEGVIIVSVVNKFNSDPLAPHVLFNKSSECVGFVALAESDINYVEDDKVVHLNVLKLPEGNYTNHNWGLYYNGPPTWGRYLRPQDPYELNIKVKAGEALYLGSYQATTNGLIIKDNSEKDLALARERFPNLNLIPQKTEFVKIGKFKGYKECK
ncbi:hypothetical protein [Colwellia sp. Bg11-28]|uniref:hypothetical protein n=1 Tax=Colwellia sp. Bg11-28 TaxID=2058305 RepID=UPI000C337081|nr:hypothetical protein [Colwellia sp. Bg11-28]PKH86850.1 hypothetical protein CXF79_08925 [Colwellia sp. Bg11-28]